MDFFESAQVNLQTVTLLSIPSFLENSMVERGFVEFDSRTPFQLDAFSFWSCYDSIIYIHPTVEIANSKKLFDVYRNMHYV